MTSNSFDNRPTGGSTEATQILNEDELRAHQRAERDRALGRVRVDDGPDPVRPEVPKPTTHKFLPSLGLFLLRLVTGGIMGIHGYQKLSDISQTQAFVQSLGLPSPQYLAWGMGIAEVLAGVALVFGLLTRVAGLGVAAITIGALALVQWKSGNPFEAGKAGFTGELELLLAAVGILFFCVGAGRWAIDGQISANRRRNKMKV
ncbi:MULTISPECIES: DoxX family protein [unclassified Luteococcus]|uniref:DoxX family protein n=1 Tax=unclassified Luteococcus TaxID=2639923 RepID=UPI00313B31F9